MRFYLGAHHPEWLARSTVTRSPGTGRELVFVDCIRRAPTTGAFTIACGGSVDLLVDDTIRIEAEAQGGIGASG